MKGEKEKRTYLLWMWVPEFVKWESGCWCLSFSLLKKCAKSSAVKEEMGGSRGGQRLELNVLKSCTVSEACVSEALLILFHVLAMWTLTEKEQSRDWCMQRSSGSFDLYHFLYVALSLCSQWWEMSNGEKRGWQNRGNLERGRRCRILLNETGRGVGSTQERSCKIVILNIWLYVQLANESVHEN